MSENAPVTAAESLGLVNRVGFIRETLLKVLTSETEFIATDLGSGGPDTLERARSVDPDLVLIDLPPDEACSLAEAILEVVPGTRPVAVHRDAGPDLLVRLAEAGFVGFVSSRCGYEDFLRELRSVVRQEWSCSPELGGALIRSLRKRPMPSEGEREYLLALTPREREIAHLLARRLSNKEIATVIGVEPGTVKNHVHNILTKLGLNHRWELGSRSR